MFGCNIPAEVWVLWGYKSGIQEDLQGGPCSEWCAFGWEGNLCKLILNKIKKVDVVLMCVCICGYYSQTDRGAVEKWHWNCCDGSWHQGDDACS